MFATTPFGTLAIPWHRGKISRRSSHGIPSVGRALNARGVAKYRDFAKYQIWLKSISIVTRELRIVTQSYVCDLNVWLYDIENDSYVKLCCGVIFISLNSANLTYPFVKSNDFLLVIAYVVTLWPSPLTPWHWTLLSYVGYQSSRDQSLY